MSYPAKQLRSIKAPNFRTNHLKCGCVAVNWLMLKGRIDFLLVCCQQTNLWKLAIGPELCSLSAYNSSVLISKQMKLLRIFHVVYCVFKLEVNRLWGLKSKSNPKIHKRLSILCLVKFKVLAVLKLSMPILWVTMPHRAFTLKMEAIYSSETWVSNVKSTLRYNRSDQRRLTCSCGLNTQAIN